MTLRKDIYTTINHNAGSVAASVLTDKVLNAFEATMHRSASGSPSTTNRSSRWALVLRIKSQTDRINNQLKNEKALVLRNEGLEGLVRELQEDKAKLLRQAVAIIYGLSDVVHRDPQDLDEAIHDLACIASEGIRGRKRHMGNAKDLGERVDDQTAAVSDLQLRNDRQYAKIQNLEEDILDLAGREGPLQTQVKNLKDDATTLAKRNEGLEMLVVELQDRNEELEETTAKVEIANGEMCEAINRLIKERDEAKERAESLKIKMAKQSARIQNLERSLENERAQGEKTTEMLDDLRRMNNSQAEALKKAWRGEDPELKTKIERLQSMNDSQAETIGKQWKDAEEASERHCAEHSKWKASSLNKIERLEQDLKEMVGINDSRQITIDNLRKQDSWSELREQIINQADRLQVLAQDKKTLAQDLNALQGINDSLKREITWKTAQIREKDHLIKELKGNVRFLDEERDILLKQRTSLQAKLKGLTEIRMKNDYVREELNKIQGILRNP